LRVHGLRARHVTALGMKAHQRAVMSLVVGIGRHQRLCGAQQRFAIAGRLRGRPARAQRFDQHCASRPAFAHQPVGKGGTVLKGEIAQQSATVVEVVQHVVGQRERLGALRQRVPEAPPEARQLLAQRAARTGGVGPQQCGRAVARHLAFDCHQRQQGCRTRLQRADAAVRQDQRGFALQAQLEAGGPALAHG